MRAIWHNKDSSASQRPFWKTTYCEVELIATFPQRYLYFRQGFLKKIENLFLKIHCEAAGLLQTWEEIQISLVIKKLMYEVVSIERFLSYSFYCSLN